MMRIAFCFDEKMAQPACVAISSLLDSKGNQEHYEIYCICNREAMGIQEQLSKLVSSRDALSNLFFLEAPLLYSTGYEVRGITSTAYLRLMLHRLLPFVDKIIYSDVDVLFCGSLAELWKTEINNFILAAVKGTSNFSNVWAECMKREYAHELEGLAGNYINSGILFMNLNRIRQINPDEKWHEMAEKRYYYQDQDILNITGKGKIFHLPLEYNVAANLTNKDLSRFAKENIYTHEDCLRAIKNPVIIHYTGEKPWINRGAHKAELWWKYVDSQSDLRGLFDKKKIKKRRTSGVIGKINRHLSW